MTSIIKPRRGTGSPAGSLDTNEIAMDTTARKLYVSTTGSDAVILADDSKTYLDDVGLVDYSGDTPIAINLGTNQIGVGAGGTRLELTGGTGNIRIKSAVDLQANTLDTTGTVTAGTLAGTNGNITTVTATTLSGTTVQSESGNDLTVFPNDDQKLVLKQTTSADTAQIDITYNGTNQFDIDADTTSGKRIALRGDRTSMLSAGASADTEVTVRPDRVVMGVDGGLYMTLRSDQVQLSKDLDMQGVDIVDANEIRGQSGSNLELKTLGTNNIKLTSTNDIDMTVGDVDTDNVNINGKTNVNATKDQPHALKVITDMEDSHALDAELHNSMTLLLNGYLQSGNGILDNVQNSLTFQVADDVDTVTVGRFNVEYQANGVGNRVKFISVNNATGTTTSNVAGAVQGTSNGQADVDGQRFKSNVPFLFPSYTTTDRGNLSNIQNGTVIYNSTTNKFQGYANGAWVDLH
jgi:hypothetical protein